MSHKNTNQVDSSPLSFSDSVLLNSILEQVVVIDSSGRIRWANDAWKESAVGRGADVSKVYPGANYLRVLEGAAQTDSEVARILDGIHAVLSGELEKFETTYECSSDDQFCFFLQRVTPLKHSIGGAIVAHLDITSQKLGELELASKRLELGRAARAAAIGQLSGAIAHEIGQPLAAIRINTNVAATAIEQGASRAEVRTILDDVEHDTRRATQILEQIRQLLGRKRPKWSELNINDIVLKALDLCRHELVNRQVRVIVATDPELPPVMGDEIGCQQVVLNLIMNSYEAMTDVNENERKLNISTARMDGGGATIIVADSGPGLTSEAVSRLFEPLFSTKSDGMGLGLSISRSIVETQGGKLSIQNASPRGVVAAVEFPITGSSE